MTIEEIESKIQIVTAKQDSATKEIDSLRKERAKLTFYGKGKGNGEEIGRIDHKIFKLELGLSNVPAELELLNSKLAEERQRIAQEEKADLINQQEKIVKEVESLSVKFIESLEKAVEINEALRNALTDEMNLRNKTGKHLLTRYCHGSQQSLSMLFETMKGQLAGRHTESAGPGIVRSATPLRL